MEFIVLYFWYILAGFLGFFIIKKSRKKDSNEKLKPLIIGHRGAAGHDTENTFFSFEKALKIGVDMLEIDLRKSSDGVFIFSHNENVIGKKNKEIKVSRQPASLLSKLILPRGRKLMIFPELLKMIPPEQKIMIDLKISGCEFELLSFLRKNNLIDRVMISSFFAQSLRLLKVLEPNLIVGISFPKDRFSTVGKIFLSPFWMPDVLLLKHTYPFYVGLLCSWARASFISVNFRFLTERLVRAAHKRDLSVYSFSVNREKDIKKMIKWGVDGIISDYPDRVKVLLGR